MIDRQHELSAKRQAELLGISRGSVYCHPEPICAVDPALMRRLEFAHRLSAV